MITGRRFVALTALVLTLGQLAGCATTAAVSAGVGVMMYIDRRSSQSYVADEAMEFRAAARINEKYGEEDVHFNVTSYNQVILITGEAPTSPVKTDVEKLVATLPGARAVINEMRIAGPSSFAARASDTYVTSKVKGRFVDQSKFPPYLVKVVTESGTVYLMGVVTQAEADQAVNIARTTGGVQRVVRAFEFISEAEAAKLDKREPGTSSAPTKNDIATPSGPRGTTSMALSMRWS